MGLLDVLNSDQGRLGLGLLAAAGGRSDGAGFGQRMAEGLGSYDHWKKQQAQAKLQKMQEEEMQAQIEARKAKAVEDARIKALIQGAGQPKLGMGAGLPAGTLPGAFDIGSQVPALEQSGKIDFQGLMRQGVPFELVKQLADSQNLGRSKVARTTEIEGPNGQKIVQGFDDYGQRVGQGENGYVAPVIVNQGGSTGFQKPVAGASFPITMSPSEKDASARGWASNALAKQRLALDQGTAISDAGGPTQLALNKRFGKPEPGRRWKEDGSLEPIPGGSADAKSQLKDAGMTGVAGVVAGLRDKYNQLNESGGIVNQERGALGNIGASLAASGLGQTMGGAVGTKNQNARDAIAMTRPILLQEIMKATGMSAKQMDSNAELKLYLSTATDPQKGYQANMEALDQIERRFGIGAQPKTADRTVVRTGVMGGKKVVQYSDGTTEYAN